MRITPPRLSAPEGARRTAMATLVAGSMAMAVGAVVLLGWAGGNSLLRSLSPGWATMQANTAAGFLFSGLALLLLHREAQPSPYKALGRAAGAAAALLGLLTLAEYVASWDLGIDRLLFGDGLHSPGLLFPGRMASSTAFCFLLCGSGLLALDIEIGRKLRPAPWLATALALIASLGVFAYLFDADALQKVAPYSSMALHTAATFLVLAGGLLSARPGAGVLSVFSAHSVSGVLLRRLLPAAVLVPTLFAWLRGSGERAGLYPSEFGAALFTTITVFTFVTLVAWAARALERSETRRHVAERALLHHAAIVASSDDAILSKTLDGRIQSWNAGAQRIFGYTMEETVGQPIQMLIPPEYLAEEQEFLTRLKRGEKISHFETRRRRKDGRIIDVSVTISPVKGEDGSVIGASKIARDITERKRLELDRQKLEMQLRQAQKMEAVGQLSGGIAHDFNNVLAAIKGNLKLAREDLPPDHPAQVSLQQVEQATERAIGVVKRLLTFSRQDPGTYQGLQLQDITAETVELARAMLPAMIEITSDLDASVPPVNADPTQVHQILLNLISNANHAMAAQTHGVIRISLDSLMVDELLVSVMPGLEPGRYARLCVSDTGRGMDKHTLERLFEPFFTTKGPGEGTGLGLSVVHGIMKAHKGAVSVYSEPGAGATFRLYFPLAEAAAQPEAPKSPQTTSIPGAGGHILYVDDEEALVFLASRTLRRRGYEVTGYTDPVQALQAVRSRPEAFDALVSDCSMLQMTGFELAAEVMKVAPQLPVILATGYIRAQDADAAARLGVAALILKPDTMEKLGSILEEAISNSRLSAGGDGIRAGKQAGGQST